MFTFFVIHGGLPRPLVEGALQMFSVEAGGGVVRISSSYGYPIIIALEDDEITVAFRAHLERLGTVRFIETHELPVDIEFDEFVCEVEAIMLTPEMLLFLVLNGYL